MRARVAELEARETGLCVAAEQHDAVSNALRERVKELDCLYEISKLRERYGITYEEILQGIVDIVPTAWQYPSITCARLVVHDVEFVSAGFIETPWRQVRDVVLSGRVLGRLEVFYTEERPQMFDGPFLEEEQKLLAAITERVANFLEQKQLDEHALEQQHQLVHLDKMAALGTLVTGVAHEINNPNNFIMLNAPVLLDVFESIRPILERYYQESGDYIVGGLPYSEMRENIIPLLSGIFEGARRIQSIVSGLKDYARVSSQDMVHDVDLNEVVRSALVLVGAAIKKSTRHFSVAYRQGLPLVRGNEQRLEQVVINLVQNACEALESKEQAIRMSIEMSASEQEVMLVVHDEGCGIEPCAIDRVTDPFYTTKRSRGGTGLGLSVSSGIVEDHGGKLHLLSVPGEGTTATVTFPASDPTHYEGQR